MWTLCRQIPKKNFANLFARSYWRRWGKNKTKTKSITFYCRLGHSPHPQDNFSSCRRSNVPSDLLPSYYFRMRRLDRDGQRLVRITCGRGILAVRNCLCLSFEYKLKSARSQQRATGILRRRYASHNPDSRDRLRPHTEYPKTTSGTHLLEDLPPAAS